MLKFFSIFSKLRHLSYGKSKVIENFLALSFIQVANYLLPFITFPYLIRTLGPDKYGLITFAQSFIQYFLTFSDYGFNLSATREISIHRNNKTKVSKIFVSVILIKTCLTIISLVVLLSLLFVIPKFRSYWYIYIFAFVQVVGNVLFPVWFFQGIEQMKYITILNTFSKLAFTISIFIFVQKTEDYALVPLINSLGYLIAGLLIMLVAFREFSIEILMPSLEEVIIQLKKGWHVFVSTVAISLYTTTRTFAVGLITNNTITGYYAIAEKLMAIIQTFPLASLLGAMYPRLSKIYSQDFNKSFKIMSKFQRSTTFCYLIGLPIVFGFAPFIVKLVAGVAYEETVLIFRLLLIAIFFINANAFRVMFLLISGREKLYSNIHLLTGIIGIILTFLFTYSFSYVGPAITIIGVEMFILILTIIKLKEYKQTEGV